MSLQRAEMEKWKIAFTDLTTKQLVKPMMEDLRFNATGVTNRRDAKGQVSLQAKINNTATIKITGPLALNPIDARLNVELQRFGIVPVQPYFTDKVNLLVSSGDVSVKSATHIAWPANCSLRAEFDGDVTVRDLASVDKAKSEDLLKWRSLFVSGVHYQHTPLSLAIDQVALSDFYSRIIMFPEGRMNLQDIGGQGPQRRRCRR